MRWGGEQDTGIYFAHVDHSKGNVVLESGSRVAVPHVCGQLTHCGRDSHSLGGPVLQCDSRNHFWKVSIEVDSSILTTFCKPLTTLV